jgi:uncharacterized protein YjbI with pentapeptide repeats
LAYQYLMIRIGPTCVLALICELVGSQPALAECADVAAPGVYWRRCLQDGQDLRGVDLTGATLRDASFERTDLSDAILVEVDARRAKFISATLQGARLDRANLVRADLTNANLTGASLVGVDLTQARMYSADLSRANLTGARLASTDLLKAILAGATWIDGKTVCAEDSVGQCRPVPLDHRVGATEPSG